MIFYIFCMLRVGNFSHSAVNSNLVQRRILHILHIFICILYDILIFILFWVPKVSRFSHVRVQPLTAAWYRGVYYILYIFFFFFDDFLYIYICMPRVNSFPRAAVKGSLGAEVYITYFTHIYFFIVWCVYIYMHA